MAMRLFVGGYTEPIRMGSGEIVEGRCPGISCYEFDSEKGILEYINVTGGVANPSYILIDPDGHYLYCVNELKNVNGFGGSSVSAFGIDPKNSALSLINREPTCGEDACHLAFSPDKKYLMVSNFGGGSFVVFPIREDGGLAGASCLFKHTGKGFDPVRQEHPHIHQIITSPDGDHIYVSDFGRDLLSCYKADFKRGWMYPEPERDIYGVGGQGTRHWVFNDDGTKLYAVTEISCEVDVFDFNKGDARLIQRISLFLDKMPEGKRPGTDYLGAGIRMHPAGKWLYASVRGSDHIAVFDVENDGRLSLSQTISSGGRIPREFIIAPDGRFLIVANQDSDNLVVFKIDQYSGALSKAWVQEEVYCPTCLDFLVYDKWTY